MLGLSREATIIILLAVAGFLIGGVYTTYKSAKFLATLLALGALLAGGGAVAWWLSSS
ncbi:hypothetical protein EV193_108232 [Herbihabitans rhizosphaerae]|uniref:Uncharacterized protein n=1 Tax=Herbihabitans rhizosphaerae TaxID=1872711 RepID=A0A4Q7KHV2_9PSEU|nr:hypothetical protein [Herbihabitans rhizosphaerae]RZS34882.1 hypothetical protein EV193_108232 [Herbihabitans rhizosphaerae]